MTWDTRLHALLLGLGLLVALFGLCAAVLAGRADDAAELARAVPFDEQARLGAVDAAWGEVGAVEWDDPRGMGDGLGRAA